MSINRLVIHDDLRVIQHDPDHFFLVLTRAEAFYLMGSIAPDHQLYKTFAMQYNRMAGDEWVVFSLGDVHVRLALKRIQGAYIPATDPRVSINRTRVTFTLKSSEAVLTAKALDLMGNQYQLIYKKFMADYNYLVNNGYRSGPTTAYDQSLQFTFRSHTLAAYVYKALYISSAVANKELLDT